LKIKILNWTYKNIRGVNNLEISVEKGLNQAYPVSLIMMPNGTGKTTTQSLLRAIFDGKAVEWDHDTVLGFKPPAS
jgi:DNA sulfur modification protein DndD